MIKEILKYGLLIILLAEIFGWAPILKLIFWLGVAYLGFSLLERIFKNW